jgi:predicted CXXCH cytochrome family protein
VLHKPFKKCSSSCHNPHASANYKLLNSPFTASTYLPVNVDSFALCWVCHENEVIGNAKTSSATSFRNGDTNLHYTHVHGEKGRSCLVCHSPHATNNQHLIRDKVAFGSWEFRMNYLSNENGGSCAPGCHAERKYTR